MNIIKKSKTDLTFLFIISCILVGCSTFDRPLNWGGITTNNKLNKITVESLSGSTLGMPIFCDYVFIYKTSLTNNLANMTSEQWFESKNALLLMYGSNLEVVSHEYVPNTLETALTLPEKSNDATAILFFANYQTPRGVIVSHLETYKEVNIKLKSDHYTIEDVSN